MHIEKFFPTLIGLTDYSYHNLIEEKLSNKCLSLKEKIKKSGDNWVASKTYNTISTYDINKDDDFKELNDWVMSQIEEYASIFKYKNKFYCESAWFNIYNKYDFQEIHNHSGYTLSAIYFLKANPETCAKTFFYSNISDGLDPDIEDFTKDTFSKINCPPVPGRLIIFKSNINHCVERQESNDLRISLAYNFKKK
jgi:uncharacterized protein (TIGR02466 family)